MKRKQLAPLALIFITALLLLFFYDPMTKYKKIEGETQGTFYTITYQDRPGRNLQPRIEQILHKFDLSLSSYNPKSVISKINRNESVRLDKYFKTVFQKALEVYHLSNGAFDITVGPIVNAWGFGPKGKIDVDSTIIDSLLKYVGMDMVSVKGNSIIKEYPEIQLDVNAIAQGYSVDIIAEFLEKKGITNYLVEIGGEVKGKGISAKDTLWKVGIDRPVDNNFSPGQDLKAILALDNKSLATSGNYRKFFEKDGVKYVHSINPKTGYPVLSRLLSVTVMANDCITADAFATAFMVMGLERTIMFLSEHGDNIDAYLIYNDEDGNYKSFMTPGISDCIISEMK